MYGLLTPYLPFSLSSSIFSAPDVANGWWWTYSVACSVPAAASATRPTRQCSTHTTSTGTSGEGAIRMVWGGHLRELLGNYFLKWLSCVLKGYWYIFRIKYISAFINNWVSWFSRQNKKQQESTKKANARKFYFSNDEWLIYEEIEDVEERG